MCPQNKYLLTYSTQIEYAHRTHFQVDVRGMALNQKLNYLPTKNLHMAVKHQKQFTYVYLNRLLLSSKPLIPKQINISLHKCFQKFKRYRLKTTGVNMFICVKTFAFQAQFNF